MIDNPEFKGEWKAKKISNPAYKGKWVAPDIDNPDFVDDPECAPAHELETLICTVLR
jgi:calreticulin